MFDILKTFTLKEKNKTKQNINPKKQTKKYVIWKNFKHQ